MGFLNALFGRSRPVKPNLDVLFAVPSAAYTLQAALGLAPTGAGAVCFKAAEGAATQQAQADIRALLDLDAATEVSLSTDEYGFTWITCRQSTVDLAALVTQLHGVNTTLVDAGLGPFLLCTNIGFAELEPRAHRRLALIYLFKRGTVYPFAPRAAPIRDTALELQVRAELAGDLPIEPDLSRWFPTWNAPVP
ncbi:MAG: PspA-associated protein PspAB [Pseudonocardiaceae bacterium]